MNKNVWIAGIAGILAPMMMHAAQKSEPALDIEKIERQSFAGIIDINASSPIAQVVDVEVLGELCDLEKMLSKQNPTSPKLTATKRVLKALTRRTSSASPTLASTSPKFQPLPAPAVVAH